MDKDEIIFSKTFPHLDKYLNNLKETDIDSINFDKLKLIGTQIELINETGIHNFTISDKFINPTNLTFKFGEEIFEKIPGDLSNSLETYIAENPINPPKVDTEQIDPNNSTEAACFEDFPEILEVLKDTTGNLMIPQVENILKDLTNKLDTLQQDYDIDQLQQTLTYRYLTSRYLTGPLAHAWVKDVMDKFEAVNAENKADKKIVIYYRDAFLFHSFLSFELNRRSLNGESSSEIFESGENRNVVILNLNRKNSNDPKLNEYVQQQIGTDTKKAFLIDTGFFGSLLAPVATALPNVEMYPKFFQYINGLITPSNVKDTNQTSFTPSNISVSGLVVDAINLIEDSAIPIGVDTENNARFMDTSRGFERLDGSLKLEAEQNLITDPIAEAMLAASAIGYNDYMFRISQSDSLKRKNISPNITEADSSTMSIGKLLAIAFNYRKKLKDILRKADTSRLELKSIQTTVSALEKVNPSIEGMNINQLVKEMFKQLKINSNEIYKK